MDSNWCVCGRQLEEKDQIYCCLTCQLREMSDDPFIQSQLHLFEEEELWLPKDTLEENQANNKQKQQLEIRPLYYSDEDEDEGEELENFERMIWLEQMRNQRISLPNKKVNYDYNVPSRKRSRSATEIPQIKYGINSNSTTSSYSSSYRSAPLNIPSPISPQSRLSPTSSVHHDNHLRNPHQKPVEVLSLRKKSSSLPVSPIPSTSSSTTSSSHTIYSRKGLPFRQEVKAEAISHRYATAYQVLYLCQQDNEPTFVA